MLAAAERRDDAKDAVARDPGRPPPRAAADQRRPTCACRSGSPRSATRSPTSPSATLDGGAGRGDRAVEARARRADADPDGDRRDGPVRRLRAGLRQRRRRDVRARAAARRRPAAGLVDGPGRGQRGTPAAVRCRRATRRSRWTPTCVPRAAGSAGAHARLLRGVLRQVVGGLGGAGAAARRRRSSATRTCASGSPS